jgi:V8-like Glu-specific endopeptidase
MINGTNLIIPPTEIATNMHIDFNYQSDPTGTPREIQSFDIIELMEYRLDGLDYAIVRVAGNPGNAFGFTGVASQDANLGDLLAIIGHPEGMPKRIEAGPLTGFSDNFLAYNDIDTLGGSSGSGILGPAGTLVGVHTNGGCDDPEDGNNYGVRISPILAASPILSGLLFPLCS